MRPSRSDHDDALLVCQKYRGMISDAEFRALNDLALAWVCNDPVTQGTARAARSAIARVLHEARP